MQRQNLNQYIKVNYTENVLRVALIVVLLWLPKIWFDWCFFYFSVHGDWQINNICSSGFYISRHHFSQMIKLHSALCGKKIFCQKFFFFNGFTQPHLSCLSFRPFLTFRPLAAWLVIKIKPIYLSSQKNTRRSIECRDHCGKIKTLKLNVCSIIIYPYFAKLFKFVVVKLKFLRKSSSD